MEYTQTNDKMNSPSYNSGQPGYSARIVNHMESNRRRLRYGLVNALKEAKAAYMERMDMHSRKE